MTRAAAGLETAPSLRPQRAKTPSYVGVDPSGKSKPFGPPEAFFPVTLNADGGGSIFGIRHPQEDQIGWSGISWVAARPVPGAAAYSFLSLESLGDPAPEQVLAVEAVPTEAGGDLMVLHGNRADAVLSYYTLAVGGATGVVPVKRKRRPWKELTGNARSPRALAYDQKEEKEEKEEKEGFLLLLSEVTGSSEIVMHSITPTDFLLGRDPVRQRGVSWTEVNQPVAIASDPKRAVWILTSDGGIDALEYDRSSKTYDKEREFAPHRLHQIGLTEKDWQKESSLAVTADEHLLLTTPAGPSLWVLDPQRVGKNDAHFRVDLSGLISVPADSRLRRAVPVWVEPKSGKILVGNPYPEKPEGRGRFFVLPSAAELQKMRGESSRSTAEAPALRRLPVDDSPLRRAQSLWGLRRTAEGLFLYDLSYNVDSRRGWLQLSLDDRTLRSLQSEGAVSVSRWSVAGTGQDLPLPSGRSDFSRTEISLGPGLGAVSAEIDVDNGTAYLLLRPAARADRGEVPYSNSIRLSSDLLGWIGSDDRLWLQGISAGPEGLRFSLLHSDSSLSEEQVLELQVSPKLSDGPSEIRLLSRRKLEGQGLIGLARLDEIGALVTYDALNGQLRRVDRIPFRSDETPAAGLEENVEQWIRTLRDPAAGKNDLLAAAGKLGRSELTENTLDGVRALRGVLVDSAYAYPVANRQAAASGLAMHGASGHLDLLLDILSRPNEDPQVRRAAMGSLFFLYYRDIHQVKRAREALEQLASLSQPTELVEAISQSKRSLAVPSMRLFLETLYYGRTQEIILWPEKTPIVFDENWDWNTLSSPERKALVMRLLPEVSPHDPYLIPLYVDFLEGALSQPDAPGLDVSLCSQTLMNLAEHMGPFNEVLQKSDILEGSAVLATLRGWAIHRLYPVLHPVSRFKNELLRGTVERQWDPIWRLYPSLNTSPSTGLEGYVPLSELPGFEPAIDLGKVKSISDEVIPKLAGNVRALLTHLGLDPERAKVANVASGHFPLVLPGAVNIDPDWDARGSSKLVRAEHWKMALKDALPRLRESPPDVVTLIQPTQMEIDPSLHSPAAFDGFLKDSWRAVPEGAWLLLLAMDPTDRVAPIFSRLLDLVPDGEVDMRSLWWTGSSEEIVNARAIAFKKSTASWSWFSGMIESAPRRLSGLESAGPAAEEELLEEPPVSPVDQEELLQQFLPVIQRVSAYHANRVHEHSQDPLVFLSGAWSGLLEAARKYPASSPDFIDRAIPVMNRRVLDQMRNEAVFSRGYHKASQALQDGLDDLWLQGNPHPTLSERATASGLSERKVLELEGSKSWIQLSDLRAMRNRAEHSNSETERRLDIEGKRPWKENGLEQAHVLVEQYLDRYGPALVSDPRVHYLLRRYYLDPDNPSLEQIGLELEISESWASKIHRAGLKELRRRILHDERLEGPTGEVLMNLSGLEAAGPAESEVSAERLSRERELSGSL